MRSWPVVVLLTLAAPASALAYEVKKSSTGAELHWADDTVVFVPALTGGPSSVAVADAVQALDGALQTWQAALGDGTQLVVGDPAAPAVHAGDGVNTVRWATSAADPDIEKGVLALTFVAYRTDTGEIADADIVLNAASFQWTSTMTGCSKAYDLQSALTHELGHALGLAHAVGHTDATMFATSDECESGKRDLAQDDQDAIDHLYDREASGGGGCAAGGSPGAGVLLVLAFVVVRRRVPAIALGFVLLAGSGADASQLRGLQLDELAQSSTIVVRGRVVAQAVTPSGPIETVADVAVAQCLGGACPATLRVKRRGGVRGAQGLWVDVEAVPVVGSDVVLYLRLAADGTYRVVGGVQGHFRVIGDRAVRDLRGHQLRTDRGWDTGAVEVVDLATLRAHAACSPSAP